MKVTKQETRANKEKFLAIYPQIGTVKAAAKEIGVTRQAIHNWLRDDEFLNADYLFQKFIHVEKILEQVNKIACGEVDKPSMVQLASAQYLLGTFLPKVFTRYKEKRDEGKRVSGMRIIRDKGDGKVEKEEYIFGEMSDRAET
uniref:Uncharacterized protein n=1 Tax=viral metagenome TaxID=1070528 RepID=A0A6M3LFL4_9ZZZZ